MLSNTLLKYTSCVFSCFDLHIFLSIVQLTAAADNSYVLFVLLLQKEPRLDIVEQSIFLRWPLLIGELLAQVILL